jgi:hypothetical protein
LLAGHQVSIGEHNCLAVAAATCQGQLFCAATINMGSRLQRRLSQLSLLLASDNQQLLSQDAKNFHCPRFPQVE